MHEPTPIILRRIQSPQHWLRFWLEKLEREMKNKGLSAEQMRTYTAALREFLTLNPGNPRAIASEKVKQFALKHKGEAAEALLFFYQHVSYSQENQASLTECAAGAEPPAALPDRAEDIAQSSAEAAPADATAKPATRKKSAPKPATRKVASKAKGDVKASVKKPRKKS